MAIYQQDILKMDMNRIGFHRSFLSYSIGKNDNIANRIGVELYRDGEPINLREASCEGFFMSPAGEHIVITGQTSGNIAFVDLPQACYNYEGQFTLAIKVISGGVTGTVRMVDGQIVNTFTDGAVAPVASVPTYQEVLAVYDQMLAAKAGAVRYDIEQELTAAQMTQARGNIAAASESDVSDLKSAFLSRRIAYDLFELYGKKETKTIAGVTYTWNGDGYTVSGTATSMSFFNLIDKSLSEMRITPPFACRIEMTGNWQNVFVQVFTMKNGNIVESKTLSSSENILFSSMDIDAVIVRLQVNSGNTASGSIKVYVSSKDIFPFGTHTLDNLANGAELNGIPDGFYLLDDRFTYSHEPPVKPAYLMSYTLFNTGVQISYPYNPTLYATFIRSKRVNGTWTEWISLNINGNDIKLFAVDGAVNIDNAKTPGFYLLYDSLTYQNLPFSGIGFLFVWQSLNVRMQMAIPWATNAIYMRRNLNNGPWSDWKAASGGNTYNVTNNYSFPEYSQSVTLNAIPSITADTNNYLPSTGDTTDRTADILAMLTATGICRLGAGDYYVSNLQMPDGSAIIGSGYATEIHLIGTDDGYAIKMGSHCMVKDLQMIGANTEPSIGENVGGRHGILWIGDYTESQTAPYRGIVSDVYIKNFSGGGITCYDTGYGTNNALEVTNVYIWSCGAGLNISYWSEFHKFTNVRCGNCYYGCVNNGGNNIFVNCDFSSNKAYAMIMDNSQGQSPNNTHGSAIGCVFNHTASGGTANAGIGIAILNCESGFVFEGCQIFFSRIHLEDSDGIVFTGCNFGLNNCNIEISGGGAIIFNGNMHQDRPTITIEGNQNVKFVNCYTRNGAEIQP